MKAFYACLAVVVVLALLAVPSVASEVTVTGEVVDVFCLTEKGSSARGDAHTACALACARRGNPVGILSDDALYEVTGDFAASNNARMLDFIAKRVTARGTVVDKDGRRLLSVTSIRAE